MSETWLVVGLGNPGAEYAATRHNVGQHAVDVLAAGRRFKAHRSQAAICETRIGTGAGGAPGPRAVLAKPTTYMNVSGGPVAALARYFDVEPERLVVVHDELDIDFGAIRLKRGGGEGGHNGLRSVTASLGGAGYLRVRVGIGRPPGRMDPADYVLREFSPPQRREADLLVVEAADAVELLLTRGLEAAQLYYHSRS